MQDKLYIEEQTLIEDTFRLGVNIYNSGFHPSFIVGLWRGGSSVGIYLQECLQYLGVETDHISIRTSYSGVDNYQQMIDDPENRIRVHGTQYLLENLNAEDRLLIVDDVHSTGLTVQTVISQLKKRLKRNMPKQVRTATVWHKPASRRTQHPPDYFLHETNLWLVLPYELNGLTVDQIKRNKPYLVNILNSIE